MQLHKQKPHHVTVSPSAELQGVEARCNVPDPERDEYEGEVMSHSDCSDDDIIKPSDY